MHPAEKADEVDVSQVTEAVSQAARAVESATVRRMAHVADPELGREAEPARLGRGARHGGTSEVDAGDVVAACRERQRMAPVAAGEIEQAAGMLEPERALDEGDLGLGGLGGNDGAPELESQWSEERLVPGCGHGDACLDGEEGSLPAR